jgi:hypothetical protein
MRNLSKTALLAGVAAGVMGLTGFAGSAMAFDVVNWEWYKTKIENINVDGTVNFDLNPSGWVEIEKLQLFIGDATATSTVNSIYNNQPSSGGDGTISFTVDWSGTQDDGPNPSDFGTGILGGPQATLSGDLSGSGDLFGTLDEGSDAMQLSATFNDIPVSVGATDTYDALTELPEVVSTAVAVGNNESIDSQVALTLHDTQVVFGGFDPQGRQGFDVPETGNSGFSMALAVLNAGATGQIYPSNINATSTVYDILNATVDSSATAVANNTNINLDAVTPDDANLEGDFTQVAYANVNATSTVYDVSLNNYTNLGSLDRPIVSSVATAVGNNLAITVTSPGP